MLLLEPTVLVFEDTHWMDDASADLLRELIKGLEQRPWLVIVGPARSADRLRSA